MKMVKCLGPMGMPIIGETYTPYPKLHNYPLGVVLTVQFSPFCFLAAVCSHRSTGDIQKETMQLVLFHVP